MPEQQQASTSPLPPAPGPATALERVHAPTDSSQGPRSAGPRGLRTDPADESHLGRPAPSPAPGAPVLEEGLSPKPIPTSQDPAETREKQGERLGLEKGQSKSELHVPHAAGSHLVGTSCSGERSSLSLGRDGGRRRAFGRYLGVQEKGGRAPRQQLHCQPRRCAPVTTYRGRWASLHPSGSESTSPLSTPPKIKCGLTSERRRVSAARGLTGTPISTSSAPLPASGRLDLEAALPAPRQRPHTAALQTRGGPRSQENTEAAHLGSATASSKRPEVWVKRGIKK